MKKMIMLISVSLTFVACVNQNKKKPNKLPNIVFIMADDMGYGDAGCYNGESFIPTPNIDMLASEGMLFTDAHSPSAVCTPSRYGLLSGRYCWRTRLKRGVILGYDETPLIEEGRNTLGSLLQESGYRTASIGKWHIGLNWQTKNNYILRNDNNKWQEYSGVIKENEAHIDFSKPVSGGPEDLGFDYSFITLGCSTSDPPYVFIENSYPVAIPSVMPPDEYIGLPGFMTGLMDPEWSQEEVDPIFTGKGIDFIDDHLENYPDKPFFLYLALSSPHIPFLVPDFAKGKTEEGPRGDLVYVVDQSVGEINKTLDKFQIKDNTLFIFTSDNGPRKGANGHKSAGDLRGFKGSVWEGGHRVPFIARWPGKIKAGSKSDDLLSLSDMFATFRDIIGYKDIEGGEDSYSILSSLMGEDSGEGVEKPRVFHSSKGVFAIRKGDWKFIVGGKDDAGNESNPDSDAKIGQLYDISSDPNETNDIWEEHPEKVKELMGILGEIRNSEN
ncbi:MAG: arylsulfatase A [Cyclobacteriaceae bacterium]|jgi:arylsulfatase A-like enzyme